MSYEQYLTCNPDDIRIMPPSPTGADDTLLKHMTRAVIDEFMQQEYKTTLHDTLFIPAIQHFTLLLRPWLLILCTIFVLLLVVGVVQLVLLITRTEIAGNTRSLSSFATEKEAS